MGGRKPRTGLVVTADDLGYSLGVDRAILAAYRDGIVRSTSLLVTFPCAEEAAEMARAERGLEIGLHLDLVEGMPVSDPADVPTLVDDDGAFLGLARLFAARDLALLTDPVLRAALGEDTVTWRLPVRPV